MKKKKVDNMHNWKDEQLQYFRKYLGMFDASSREHTLLREGIDELEKS